MAPSAHAGSAASVGLHVDRRKVFHPRRHCCFIWHTYEEVAALLLQARETALAISQMQCVKIVELVDGRDATVADCGEHRAVSEREAG